MAEASDVGAPKRWSRKVATGLWAALTYYPPHSRQAAHSHDHFQLSLLLAGEMREELGNGEFDMATAALGVKPVGARHEDRWGPSGALLFTLNAAPDALPRDFGQPRWLRCAGGSAARRVDAFVNGGSGDRDEIAFDLLALACRSDEMPDMAPPRWLRDVRESIDDDPAARRVAAIAETAGVHRVHLSRAFARHYGVSPSVYRRRRMVSRLVGSALSAPGRLTDHAYEAGFCDQSHAVRAVREDVGINLGALRRMMAG